MYQRNAQIINQQFSKYFLPTVLMTLALSMSIVVDGIIVGNFLGAEALAAVNIVMPVTLILNAVYALAGVGGSTLFSVALGRQDKKNSSGIFFVSVVLMIVIAAVLCVLGRACIQPLSIALTSNAPNLTALVSEYMGTLFWGAPFLILVPGLVYFLRAAGNPKLSSSVLIIANVINLSLDLLFILVFKMGVGGAALATVTGYAVGLIIVIIGVAKNKTLRMSKVGKGFMRVTGDICATGFPSALSTVLNFLRLTLINQIVMATLGGDGAVAFSVCMSCLSLTAMFVGGAAQTMIPFFGTLYGEKDYAGMRFTVNKSIKTVVIASVALLIIFELFPAQICMLFGVVDPVQIAIAVEAIRIYSVSLPFMGFLFIAVCVYQVSGKRKLSSLIPLLENLVIVVPLAFWLSVVASAVGIWSAFPLSEIITIGILMLITTYMRKKLPESKGILLMEEQRADNLDVSINMEVEQGTGLSAISVDFCTKHGIEISTANKVGIAIEEIVLNTIEQEKNHKNKMIDVRLTISQEEAVISVRDNASPLDPLKSAENDMGNGIGLLLAIAKDVKYNRLLGMNCTQIEIAK